MTITLAVFVAPLIIMLFKKKWTSFYELISVVTEDWEGLIEMGREEFMGDIQNGGQGHL